MIPAVIALLAMQATVLSEAAPSDEIVVIGERMRRIRVVTRRDRKTGRQRCIVRRSSGDDALDAAVCTATLACAETETTADGMAACMRTHMLAIAQGFAKRSLQH
jgi:hypothetical protein